MTVEEISEVGSALGVFLLRFRRYFSSISECTCWVCSAICRVSAWSLSPWLPVLRFVLVLCHAYKLGLIGLWVTARPRLTRLFHRFQAKGVWRCQLAVLRAIVFVFIVLSPRT